MSEVLNKALNVADQALAFLDRQLGDPEANYGRPNTADEDAAVLDKVQQAKGKYETK